MRNWLLIGGVLLGFLIGGLWYVRRGDRVPDGWTVGYWVWELDPARPLVKSGEVGLVAFRMGDLVHRESWERGSEYEVVFRSQNIKPKQLPVAERYVAVVRFEFSTLGKNDALLPVIRSLEALQTQFQMENRRLDELQIDFDCPTTSLPQYASLLEDLRKQLPAGARLSVTALLDWFREGTEIEQVLSRVDSFIPQFYDVDPHERQKLPGIAHMPDHQKCGPIFERFRVPYFIGLASFGRIQVSKDAWYLSNESPMELFHRRVSEQQVSSNDAWERVLRMKVLSGVYPERKQDEGPVEACIIQPTAESVRRSFEEARSMGRHCAGVMFFRWPGQEETLALSPDEVSDILEGHQLEESYELEKADAECVLVNCQDLTLVQKNRFPSRSREVKIQLSAPLQYFLPSRQVKSKLLNDRELCFQIPAYNATARIYLGRAVTGEPAEYKVLVEP